MTAKNLEQTPVVDYDSLPVQQLAIIGALGEAMRAAVASGMHGEVSVRVFLQGGVIQGFRCLTDRNRKF